MNRWLLVCVPAWGFPHYGFIVQTADDREHTRFVAEASAWCRDQFGPRDGVRWWLSGGTLYIHDQVDATAFKLRWV